VVVFTEELGETEFVRNVDFLTSREFKLRTTKTLNGVVALVILATHGDQDLTDIDTSGFTVGLTERATHTSLQSIRTSARKHLVHTKDVERMGTDTDVEGLLTAVGHHVLVHRNTSRLQGFHRKLLFLVGDHVDGAGVGVRLDLLGTSIEDTNLRVRHTSAEAGLRVRLVLAVPVALIRSAAHFDWFSKYLYF